MATRRDVDVKIVSVDLLFGEVGVHWLLEVLNPSVSLWTSE